MPSSIVLTFSEPDEYAASLQGAQAELTVTRRGQFTAKQTRIILHRLWMQRFDSNLPWVGHTATLAERAYVSFRTEDGPSLLSGGVETRASEVMRHSAARTYYLRSSGLARSGFMSLPVEDMLLVGATIAGCDLAPPKDPLTLNPAPHAMMKLQRLHAAAGRLAEEAPEIIAQPDAARGLEQTLIEAMVDCFASREARENTLPQGQHAIVMRRFRRVVEENPEQPLYIPEICKAIGVSSRTLQACCHEHLGMGPKRYLLLRRMHLARRTLRLSAPEAASVTEIATRYGFWQLGRFAVEYQSLFGEPPSATLGQQSI
jgi:AraC-like DNA-binding protein